MYPPVEVVEDGRAGRGWISEPLLLAQFALQAGEEALALGVFASIADRAHWRADAGMLAAKDEGNGGILNPLVRVSDDTGGAPLRDGQVQCPKDQVSVQVGLRMDDPPTFRLQASRTTASERKLDGVGT